MDKTRDKQPYRVEFFYDIKVNWDLLQSKEKFTPRQIEILQKILEGYSGPTKIGAQIGLSTQTIKNMIGDHTDMQSSKKLNLSAPSTKGLRTMIQELIDEDNVSESGWIPALIKAGYATLVPKKDRE